MLTLSEDVGSPKIATTSCIFMLLLILLKFSCVILLHALRKQQKIINANTLNKNRTVTPYLVGVILVPSFCGIGTVTFFKISCVLIKLLSLIISWYRQGSLD